MNRWKYAPLKWMIELTARLPMPAIHLLADAVYVAVYHVARYRREVVVKHIADSFPELPEARRRHIVKRFYHNFADYIMETVKLAHVTDGQMKRMMTFNGMDHVDRLLGQGRSIAAYFSHTFNWEWVPSITLWSATKQAGESEFCQVYRPLRDPWFDRYMLKLRGRFNPLSCPKSTVLRDLIKLRRQGIPSITGFMSDQKPSHGDPTRVLMFLNHPTAFITGTETLARKMKMAAVYFDMRKTSRGHYRIDIIPLTDDASTLPEMELTDTYARMLEATIRRDPSLWLWTHKRWKHPVEMPQSPTPPTSNGK